MPTGWIDIGRAALRYALAGTNGPLVVLLHEMGGTLESWDAMVPELARDHRVLRLDMRGCGLSEKISGDIAGEELAEDLLALLDALGLGGKAALVGIAVGANIALRFADRHPDRVGALILCSPAFGIPAERRSAALDTVARLRREGPRAIAEVSFAGSFPPALRDEDPARYAATRARWLANDRHSFAAIYHMLAHSDLDGALGRVSVPSLVIGCTLDAVRPAQDSRAVAARIPGARFAMVRSGHFASIQHPDLLLALLLPFLAAHRAALVVPAVP